jgi:hypothetical protein
MYAYYEGLASSPATPNPTLAQKYSSNNIAPDLDDFVESEYSRLVALLPNAPATGILPNQISIGVCDPNTVILVRTVPATGANPASICISALIITSVFFKNAGTALLSYNNNLKSMGINPTKFDGTYDPTIAQQHGLTVDDWNSGSLAGQWVLWNSLLGSLDFIIAQQLSSALPTSPGQSPPTQHAIDSTAKALVAKSGTAWDISALVLQLQSNQAYPSTDWGYQTIGDGDAILNELNGL